MAPSSELSSVEVTSGVSATTGEPFCNVIAHGADGRMLLGQLDPATVRSMALDWLAAAEAAVHDAALFRLLRERLELDERLAAELVADLRTYRADT